MDKWAKNWLTTHKDATMQEFAVELSKRTTRTFITLYCVQIILFIAVIIVASFFN